MVKNLPIYDLQLIDETDGLCLVSIVASPAVESNFLMFSDESRMEFSKLDEEKHICSGLALIAGKPIYRIDESGFEYLVQFSAETIEKLVEKFFASGLQNNVSLEHSIGVSGVTVFESFLINSERGIKPIEFPEATDGSWYISMKVNDDSIWEAIKKNSLAGFSVECFMSPIKMSAQKNEKTDWVENILKGKF